MKRLLIFLFLISSFAFAQKSDSLSIKKQDQIDYDTLIAQGDRDFKMQEWGYAYKAYHAASKFKPGEKYPKDMMEKIKNMKLSVDVLPPVLVNYLLAVSKGDSLFSQDKYAEAKTCYEEACSLRPEEKYAHGQVETINRITNDNVRAGKYKQTIKIADSYFEAKDFINSKKFYQQAQKIKPEEKYPKDRIAEIDKILAGTNTAPVITKYKEAIVKADSLFTEKKYEEAKKYYQQACSFMPNEKYPKDQIQKIDKILEQ